MDKRIVPVAALTLGVLLFLVALTADFTGIGGAPGFGWKQITGAIVGVIAVAVGVVLLRRPSDE